MQLVVIQMVAACLRVGDLAPQLRLHLWVLCQELQRVRHGVRRGVHRGEDNGPEELRSLVCAEACS